MFYTASLSIVPPVVSFTVPNAPIMSSMSFAMATWFLSAPLASLSLFKDSHSRRQSRQHQDRQRRGWRRRGGGTNNEDDASKPPTMSTSRPLMSRPAMTTRTSMTTEWLEEARRHDKQQRQHVKAAVKVVVEIDDDDKEDNSNDEVAWGGTVVWQTTTMACQNCQQHDVKTFDNNDNGDINNKVAVWGATAGRMLKTTRQADNVNVKTNNGTVGGGTAAWQTTMTTHWNRRQCQHQDQQWCDVSRLERYRTNILLACLTKVRC